MKVFISQPMLNKPNEYILEKRKKILELVKKQYPNAKIKLVGFFKNCHHEKNPLWYLARSLKVMSTCDLVVFAQGYNLARGCRIEHKCALSYGLNMTYEDYLLRI